MDQHEVGVQGEDVCLGALGGEEDGKIVKKVRFLGGIILVGSLEVQFDVWVDGVVFEPEFTEVVAVGSEEGVHKFLAIGEFVGIFGIDGFSREISMGDFIGI